MVSFRGLLLSTGAGILAVVGFGFGVEEFVLLAIALGVLLVLGAASVLWRARVARRGLRFALRVPAMEVNVGQAATMEMEITNSGPHTVAALRIEAPARHWTVTYPGLGARHDPTLAPSVPAESNPIVALARTLARSLPLADIGPRSATTLRIPVPTAVRGVVTLHPVGVWSEDPFRLFALRGTVAPSAHMIVCPVPDMTQAAHLPTQTVMAGRPSDPRPGAAPSASVAGDDLSSLRPYVPGDHLNRLHWPALARTGELVVRDFTAPESGRLALLVDLRPSAHGASSFEAAIARVAALGARALADGVALELCTSAGERLEIPAGLTGRQALMRALALLGPTNPPTSSALRWTGRSGSAVWAAAGVGDENMVLITTDAGAASALPEILQRRASVETVR